MTNKDKAPSLLKRIPRFAIVLALIFIPTLAVLGTVAVDRLGYCVNDIFPGDFGLDVNPYVQNVQQDSAVIVWRTTSAKTGEITWTDDQGNSKEKSLPASEIQLANLDGLTPDSTYDYSVKRGEENFEGTFQTAPERDASVQFGVLGDSGTGSNAQLDISRQLRAAQPDFVVMTGDLVYRRGELCHYSTRYFPQYGEMIASVPVYPTLGNHDLMAKGGRAYFETFDLPPGSEQDGERYYSFDYGPVHVSVVNSEFYADKDDAAIERQRSWLADDLASDNDWKIVVLHRPPVSSTSGKESPDIFTDLSPIFEQNDVNLVLSGHAHNYERSKPINGVTYVVSGGGGADLYNVSPSDTSAVAIKSHNFLMIQATPKTLAANVLNRDGETIDSFKLEPANGP